MIERNKKKRRPPYVGCLLLILLLVTIYWFSEQQGKVSHGMSKHISESVVTYINEEMDLKLTDKQYKTFVSKLDHPVRKMAHISEFAAVGLVLYIIVSRYSVKIWKRFIICILFLILFGTADEIHQLYIVARECRWQDVVIDTVGGSFGVAVGMIGHAVGRGMKSG